MYVYYINIYTYIHAVHVLARLRLSWQRSCSTRLRIFWSSVLLSLVSSVSSSWLYEDRLAWNSLRRAAYDETIRTEIASYFFIIFVLHLIKDSRIFYINISLYFYVPRSVGEKKHKIGNWHPPHLQLLKPTQHSIPQLQDPPLVKIGIGVRAIWIPT